MAINILSIPSILVEAEQVFSGARRTISWDRISLGSTNIKRTECLKSWLRSNITAGGKIVAVQLIDKVLLDGGGSSKQSTTTTLSQRL